MDKFKKKSLNFMGFSRDLRKIELDNKRSVSRLNRFSVVRPLDDDSISEEKKENSKIPMIGKPKTQAGSRVELLQKWKQEKIVKKQHESKLKKPVFKVGVVKSNPSPSLENKPLFALDSSRLLKSSFQVSYSRSYAKKPDIATNNIKTRTKDTTIHSSNSKTVNARKPESKWTKAKESNISVKPKVDTASKVANKESNISVKPKVDTASKVANKESNIQSLNLKPKVDTASKVVDKNQISGGRKQPTITSKPLETKKESRLQPLNTRSKVISTAKGVKSNIPSSGLPKPTSFRALNSVSNQTHIPKSSTSKIPDGNSNDKNIPVKNNVKSIPKFSKTVASQQKGNISEEASTSESKVPNKPHDDFPTFECELSYIEPVKEQRKSFAPKGFKFQPPAELSSSLFSEDGPSAIFLRMKNQFLRTSTPKQSPSGQNSSPKIKDIECLENEDSECFKNENSQCCQNTDKEFEPANKHDLETLLSSSLGSVSLNDMKSIDCKQSLKFESPEVISTQNQEEILLSSKIIYPEHSLATEPLSTGAINQPDSVEIGVTDIGSTGAINPPIQPDSAEIYKTEINSTDISSIGAVNPRSLIDLVKIDKTEINSTDTSPANDNKITVPFPDDGSVFYESKEMPDENMEKNQFKLNDLLQKQENDSIKIPIKIRNFRRSEKPGLMSINESLENTPKSTQKKKFLESDFTPRRSLRLAKLSGNFSSLDNLLDFSKPKDEVMHDKPRPKGYLTPRRSSRLSKFSTEFNSAENLFNIKRPTFFGSPEEDVFVPKLHSEATYDFDRLSLEMEKETPFCTTISGKVSLLPVSRPSIMRRSIKGDLMSFSPDV